MGGKKVRAASVFLTLATALWVSGCAVSIPIPGLSHDEDDAPTGSISRDKPTGPAHLASWVDLEDTEAVLSALGEALDPQGPGNPIDWKNDDRQGTIRPAGRAQPAGDLICRAFTAEGAGSFGPYRAAGTACRDKRGVWAIRDSLLRPRS